MERQAQALKMIKDGMSMLEECMGGSKLPDPSSDDAGDFVGAENPGDGSAAAYKDDKKKIVMKAMSKKGF